MTFIDEPRTSTQDSSVPDYLLTSPIISTVTEASRVVSVSPMGYKVKPSLTAQHGKRVKKTVYDDTG